MSKAQKNFLSGALILTIANAMVNVIGAFYKIPLANLITPTGMNYYNDGYQIYALLFVLSTAGVPVAISKMVSEAIAQNRKHEPEKILKNATVIFGIIGFLMCSLMILFVRPLSGLLQNGATVNYCIAMIAPSIFFVCISAVIKGYFQGYKCMTPSAVYQVIEAAFKLVGLGVVAVMVLKGITDPMILACGGILGVTFGAFASAVFMVIRYLRENELGADIQNSLPSRANKKLVSTIITLAIPVSLSNAVMSVTSTLDMILVKWNLSEYGLNNKEVMATYGAYVGSTSSLFNLVPAVTISVGIAVLPFLTGAFAGGKKAEAYSNMRSSAKVVSLIAMPCALGMSVMSEQIVKLLFRQSYWSVGIPTLRALAISTFFVSFVSLTGIFLQSVGKVKTSLMTMGIGAVVKLTVNILAVRNIGIMGAPIGTFCCYGTITLLNIFFIYRFMGFKFPVLSTFLKPLICSIICCAGAFGTSWLLIKAGLSLKLALFPAVAVAAGIYIALILVFKVLNKEDMLLIPKGQKLGEIMQKRGWLHE